MLLGLCGMSIGCRDSSGPRVVVAWSKLQPAIKEGTLVKFAGTAMGGSVTWVDVGRVVEIESAGPGIRAIIDLKRSMSHYVTTKSAFILREDDSHTIPFIEVHELLPNADPIVPGMVFRAAESEVDLVIQRVAVDWQTTLIWAVSGIATVLVAILVVKALFKGFVLILCLGTGVVGSAYLKPILMPHILPLLPEDIPLDPFVYGAGFLAAYITAVIIVTLFRLPISAVSGR